MKIDNLRVEKITDLPYRDKLPQIDNDAIYCEIQYKRDRSSFAGMAFKFIDKENVLKSNFVEEKVIQIVSKYVNLCVGSDLQYSDVRSSQIIYEDLVNCIDKNWEMIKSKIIGEQNK